MYFCDDVDLMVWEPGIFSAGGADAFAHQALLKNAAATLTGTALTTETDLLGALAPGMVLLAEGGGVSQLLEVTAVADARHATVSALRGRADETPLPGLVSGSVTVTLVSFRPQIAAVGDELLALVGVISNRGDAGETVAQPRGFRTACVLGTLAAIFRVLAAAPDAPAGDAAKREFYEKAYADVRRSVRGTIDGRPISANVGPLTRD
jgi:hypothetical protein